MRQQYNARPKRALHDRGAASVGYVAQLRRTHMDRQDLVHAGRPRRALAEAAVGDDPSLAVTPEGRVIRRY